MKIIIGLIYEDSKTSEVEIELSENFLSRPARDQEAALFRLHGESMAAHGDALCQAFEEADEEIMSLKTAVAALAA